MSSAEQAGPTDGTVPDGGGREPAVRRDEVPGPDGPLPRVSASGELDAATAPELLEALTAAIPAAARARGAIVVGDLDGVTFCDSRGLSTLVRATRAAARAGASLRLVAGEDTAVARLLARTGMTDLLPLYPDVAAAVAADTTTPLEQEVDPGSS
jgi:anti-sigma B factor antagonist